MSKTLETVGISVASTSVYIGILGILPYSLDTPYAERNNIDAERGLGAICFGGITALSMQVDSSHTKAIQEIENAHVSGAATDAEYKQAIQQENENYEVVMNMITYALPAACALIVPYLAGPAFRRGSLDKPRYFSHAIALYASLVAMTSSIRAL